MKKFTITIEEIISERFYIEAETAEEAMEIAKQKYQDGDFVLEPGNLIAKQMGVASPEGIMSEWVEF